MSSSRRRSPRRRTKETGEKGGGGKKSKSRSYPGESAVAEGSPLTQTPEEGVYIFDPRKKKQIGPFFPTRSADEKNRYYAEIRAIRDWEAAKEEKKTGKPSKKRGGAPNKINKQIMRGKLTRRELWEKYNEYVKQGKYNKGEIELFLAEYLTKLARQRKIYDWKISKKTGLAISTDAVHDWLLDPDNRLPEEELKVRTGETPIEKLDEYQEFLNQIKKVKKSTQTHYIGGVADFYAFMKEEGRSLDPHDWTPSDFHDWGSHRFFDEGRASTYLRAMAVGWRQFMQLGMGKSTAFMKKCGLGTEYFAKQPPAPGSIRYIPVNQYDKYAKYMPIASYSCEFKVGKKTRTRAIPIRDEAERLQFIAAARLSGSTGARSGSLVDAASVGRQTTAKDLLERIKKRNTGTAYIRLKDLQFNGKIKVQDPTQKKQVTVEQEKQITVEEVALLTYIHEKMNEEWANIPLPDKTAQVLQQYLRARFDLAEDTDLDGFLRKYVRAKEHEFNDYRLSLVPEHERIKKIKDADIKENEYQTLGKRLLKKYQEDLLLFPAGPDKLRQSMYCTLHRAQQAGDPIIDDMGDPWTPERLVKEGKVWHIWRKSFAQNLLERGVPLEQVADMGVGWKDPTTLKIYYGSTARPRLNTTFIQKMRYW